MLGAVLIFTVGVVAGWIMRDLSRPDASNDGPRMSPGDALHAPREREPDRDFYITVALLFCIGFWAGIAWLAGKIG